MPRMTPEILYVVDPDVWILDALTEADKQAIQAGTLKIIRTRVVEEVDEHPGCRVTRITVVPYPNQ